MGSDVNPKYLPKRQGDIKHSQADISNLEKINLKIDTTNFENQLSATVKWFEEEFKRDIPNFKSKNI